MRKTFSEGRDFDMTQPLHLLRQITPAEKSQEEAWEALVVSPPTRSLLSGSFFFSLFLLFLRQGLLDPRLILNLLCSQG